MDHRFHPSTNSAGVHSRIHLETDGGGGGLTDASSQLTESDLYRLASSALAVSATGTASVPQYNSSLKGDRISGAKIRSSLPALPPYHHTFGHPSTSSSVYRSRNNADIGGVCAVPSSYSASVSNVSTSPPTRALMGIRQNSDDRSDGGDHLLSQQQHQHHRSLLRVNNNMDDHNGPQDHHSLIHEQQKTPNSPRSSRMEKKRKREMQRRSNVNRELERLSALVIRINPPELREKIKVSNNSSSSNRESGSRSSSANNKDNSNEGETEQPSGSASLNRVELIHLAANLLSRYHEESEKNQTRVQELEKKVNKHEEANKVTMMFPIMVPSDQPGRHGEPVPQGVIPLPPMIPSHLLYGRPRPLLYNTPPFPSESCYCVGRSSVAPTEIGASHGPHFVLVPEACAASGAVDASKYSGLEALVAAKVAEEVAARTSEMRRAVASKDGNG